MEVKLTEIEIKNMRVRAILGIMDWERKKKQDIVISIRFRYDAAEAIAEDKINEAVDYKKISKEMIKFIETSDFYLIETLTDTIYDKISQIQGVVNTAIEVQKPHALRFCDNLLVRRSDYE